jgi:PEP-CTERM motif
MFRFYLRRLVVSSGMMLLLLGPGAPPAPASPILLPVSPALVTGPPIQGFYELDFFFGDELDGTTLSGQAISLDFVFADDILARVLTFGGLSFDALVSLQTDADTFPGFPGDDSTGFLLAPGGTPVHSPLPPEWVGGVAGSNGSLGVGLFPQVVGYSDISGVHYDISLPATGHSITGGRIRLVNHNDWGNIQFGTAAQLPEPSTLLLFSIGAACAACARMKTRRRTNRFSNQPR